MKTRESSAKSLLTTTTKIDSTRFTLNVIKIPQFLILNHSTTHSLSLFATKVDSNGVEKTGFNLKSSKIDGNGVETASVSRDLIFAEPSESYLHR